MEKAKKIFRPHGIAMQIIVTTVGCAIMSVGLNLFTIPNNIAPGGLAGLATALGYLFNLPVGVLTFGMNCIVLVFALKIYGFKSMLMIIYASVIYATTIDVFGLFLKDFGFTDDMLLAAVLGGALIGAGVGLLFMENNSTAGTDLISRMLRKSFPQIPAGSLMFFVDAFVVLVAVIVFKDIKVALYSGVSIFVMSKVIDAILHGVENAQVVMIVTDMQEEMEKMLCNDLGRGVTELPAKGAYSKMAKTMLLTVARRNEVTQTLKAVRSVDKKAFIIMYNASEVHGEGFHMD